MIAVLLIAGVGRRLSNDKPKVLLEVGGKTLLDRHLANLAALKIPVLAVTGWQAETVPVKRQVVNPEFRRGSLLSLKAGLDAVVGATAQGTEVYADGTTSCHREYGYRPDAKLSGAYTLPWEIQLAGTFQFAGF